MILSIQFLEHFISLLNHSMATTTKDCDSDTTSTADIVQPTQLHSPTLVLKLHRATETGPRVRWTEETIDNEDMNKKKSKCCCIYTKPHNPESDDDKTTQVDEYSNCQHCRYHTESDYAAKSDEHQPKVKLLVDKPKAS